MILPCHRSHILHEKCFTDFEEFSKKTNRRAALACPVCRKKVDTSAIVKQQLINKDQNQMSDKEDIEIGTREDVFKLPDIKQDVKTSRPGTNQVRPLTLGHVDSL